MRKYPHLVYCQDGIAIDYDRDPGLRVRGRRVRLGPTVAGVPASRGTWWTAKLQWLAFGYDKEERRRKERRTDVEENNHHGQEWMRTLEEGSCCRCVGKER